jgi:hypothetical protein
VGPRDCYSEMRNWAINQDDWYESEFGQSELRAELDVVLPTCIYRIVLRTVRVPLGSLSYTERHIAFQLAELIA